MSFLVNWWLGYRRRQHRRSFVPFAAVGVACSVLLFAGAYGLMTRPPKTEAPLGLPAGRPDFVALMPSAEGELNRSVVRLPDDRLESYVVGFRGQEGPTLGLVTKSLMGYRIAATMSLPGVAADASTFPSVYLWPGAAGQERVVAVVRQADGWSAAYAVLVSGSELKLIERLTPMSDVPPQHVAVGEVAESRRTARFGDLDGDGTPDDLMVEIRQAGQLPRYEAYTLRDGQLAWRQDLIDTLKQTAGLFADARADIGEMLVIEGVGMDAQPTVVEFPPGL